MIISGYANKYKAYEQWFKITGVATENKNVVH
jgi:hypothetical protein